MVISVKSLDEAIKKGAGGTISIKQNPHKTIIVENSFNALCDLGKAALERSKSLISSTPNFDSNWSDDSFN